MSLGSGIDVVVVLGCYTHNSCICTCAGGTLIFSVFRRQPIGGILSRFLVVGGQKMVKNRLFRDDKG